MQYDLIVAGGGIAGAALAFRMAQSGARVLIVEREVTFRDRVRGESIHPWGVAEAAALGLSELLATATFAPVYDWELRLAGVKLLDRNLAHSRARQPAINVHHPEFQQALLDLAQNAGAEIWRGSRVAQVDRGRPARVTIERGAGYRLLEARLVVAADGRDSSLRRAAGVGLSGQRSELLTSGLLVRGHSGPCATIGLFHPFGFCELALWVPLPGERVRLYGVRRGDAEGERFNGAASVSSFFAWCQTLGMPRGWLENAAAFGPLATYETALTECKTVALDGGLVFLGDAAGVVDPAFGCGLSLALMDARSLGERLLENRDWNAAAARHALDRSVYAASLRKLEAWMTRLFYTAGQDELRARALPRLSALRVDLLGSGPASPTDSETEAALFE
ncbi:MAG TPA: FAD-dependent monooxygenase [Polyangiaceae bacterium]|nr:FAD-dependent monooxygenase [Polyangiaceae bacterium]